MLRFIAIALLIMPTNVKASESRDAAFSVVALTMLAKEKCPEYEMKAEAVSEFIKSFSIDVDDLDGREKQKLKSSYLKFWKTADQNTAVFCRAVYDAIGATGHITKGLIYKK